MDNYDSFVKSTVDELNGLPAGGDVLNQIFASPLIQRHGTWVEFGVADGGTLRIIADNRGSASVWGFDTFEGLPEDWYQGDRIRWPKGKFAVNQIPRIPGTHIVTGLFQDTLPAWKPIEPLTFVHIDCDIYSATCCIFKHIVPMLDNGAIIEFDELFNYSGFENHEMKALYEAYESGLRYDWLFVYGGGDTFPNERAALIVKK